MLVTEENDHIIIELTRRNLMALLAKLDGNPPNSACTLIAPYPSEHIWVKAVEDNMHYGDRWPGELHTDTLDAITDDDALDRHLEEHGCGTVDHNDPNYVGGFIHCPEAKEIWEQRPPEKRVVLG